MAKVVVIKFRNSCKPYYFGKGKFEPQVNQHVIVETARGLEFGTVVEAEREVPDEAIVQPLKPLIRIATERDEEAVRAAQARRGEAMAICREKIEKHGLEMKLIDCEFTFDGSKVIFTFSAEGRVDFRELVKDLASVFHLRIELKQVGVRDEAKILGGIAPCGRVCCCASCMPEFTKVSIKMAKNQGLSLNPGKISGLCGRLMCCLSYENEYYAAVYKKMPKLGASVETPEGTGSVVSVNMLKLEVRVKIERDGAVVYRDFPLDAISRRGAQPEPEEDDEEDGSELSEASAEASEKQPEKPRPHGREQNKKRDDPSKKNGAAKKGGNEGGKPAKAGGNPPAGETPANGNAGNANANANKGAGGGRKKRFYRGGKGGKKPE